MKLLDINGLKGYYKISENGDIYSYYGWNGREYFKRKKPLKLKPFVKENGYLTISISNKNLGIKMKDVYVHRLVAEYFCDKGNYDIGIDELTVNHKDFNKKNNHYSNLEWCTRKENYMHYKLSSKYDEVEASRIKNIRDKKRKRKEYHSQGIIYMYCETKLNVEEIAYLINVGRDFVSEILKDEKLL